MLRNRLTRLITVVLLALATLVVIMLLFEPISSSSGLLMSLLSTYAIGIVYQICADFLNFSFLDNLVGKIIKRVLVFAVVAVALFLSVVMYFADVLVDTYLPLDDFGIIYQGAMISGFFAPVVAFLACTAQDQIIQDEEKTPFIPAVSIIASIILGIITAITGLYILLAIVLEVVGILAIVLIMKQNGVIFDERIVTSYSGGNSGNSGGNLGGSLSNLDDDDEDTQKPDERKNDGFIFNEMSSRMRSVASRYSRCNRLSRGAYLTLNIKVSASARSVVFTVDSLLEIDKSYIEHQSDVSCIQNEARSLLSDVASDLKRDAESEIYSLRREYRDYDANVSIRVSRGYERTQTR